MSRGREVSDKREDAPPIAPEVRVGSNGDALSPISSARRSFAPDAVAWATFAGAAATASLVDRVTKAAIGERLRYGVDTHLVGPLSLTHASNSGIAFGLFATRTTLIALLGALVLGGLVLLFVRVGAADRRLPLAVGLLAGGAFGNVADRLRFGQVTDFVELRYWPAFNLADVFIVTGVVALVLLMRHHDRPQPRQSYLLDRRPND